MNVRRPGGLHDTLMRRSHSVRAVPEAGEMQ